jgi:hypothetical protein
MSTRTLAGLASVSLVALLVGCGSGDGGTVPADDAGTSDTGTSSDATLDTSSPFPDATVGNDSGPPELDATLDIGFPDSFTFPDVAVPDGSVSVDSGCSPNGIACSGNVAYACSNGTTTVTNCTQLGKTCADGYGCVTCVPGSGTCNGSTGTLCKSDGSGYVTNNCDPLLGLTCNGGTCSGACANIGQSYIGCEYYAVTTLNHLLDQGTFTFSVSISNTGPSAATVTITGANNFNSSYNVAAGAIVEVTLPWVSALSCGAGPCNGGQPATPTTARVNNGSYRIRSTQPVTVYQFNARDYTKSGLFSYTNDASLLLPVNAMSGNYYVASHPSFYQWPGLIDIVATQDNTQVTLTPSTTIAAGGGLATNGGTVTLNRGDVVQVTNPVPGSISWGTDMSGSTVTANAPIEVFGGHACVYIPSSQAACDHLEEVMFPTETLRTDYVVVPPAITGFTPKHYVRIIGTTGGTTLTYSPAVAGAPATLGAGQVGVFETTTPFLVSANANHPILVASYFEGAQNFGGGLLAGDPAMTLAVATGQFRTNYAFTAPNNYQINWVTVVAPTNGTVSVDGTNVASWTNIGASGYRFAYVQLSNSGNGTHSATGSLPFGIQVYGYGSYTSYAYPGGLDLKR